MAEAIFRMNQQTSPPLIARLIVRLLSSPEDLEILLGDLQEEFEVKQKLSMSKANSWYWWQAIFSIPHLLLSRFRSNEFRQFTIIILMTVIAFLLISLWDIYVARSTARYFASITNDIPIILIRCLYFTFQCIGAVVVGGFLALIAFKPDRSFLSNSLFSLGPIVLILTISALVTFFNTGGTYPNLYIVLRAILSSIAVFCGAYLATVVYKSVD